MFWDSSFRMSLMFSQTIKLLRLNYLLFWLSIVFWVNIFLLPPFLFLCIFQYIFNIMLRMTGHCEELGEMLLFWKETTRKTQFSVSSQFLPLITIAFETLEISLLTSLGLLLPPSYIHYYFIEQIHSCWSYQPDWGRSVWGKDSESSLPKPHPDLLRCAAWSATWELVERHGHRVCVSCIPTILVSVASGSVGSSLQMERPEHPVGFSLLHHQFSLFTVSLPKST